MIDNRAKLLAATVHKFYKRSAFKNLEKVLSKSHTVDIAALLAGFPKSERLDIFKMEVSLERRAEILSYLEEGLQEEILSSIEVGEAKELVSLMDTDDAASVLRHIPEELSNQILASMDKEDSEEVTDLLAYPEESAGAFMSTDLLALNENLSVRDAIQKIQDLDDDSIVTFYVYVTNETGHLVGVLSLKQLLLSKPAELLRDIMTRDVITVDLDTDQQEVARLVERYDFLAVPVANASNELMGVITVDDVIDVIRAESEEDLLAMGRVSSVDIVSFVSDLKARLPWLILAFTAGLASFALIYLFATLRKDQFQANFGWVFAAFIPMILTVGATTGNQAVAITVGFLKGGLSGWKKVAGRLLTEVKLGIVFALIFMGLVFLMGQLFSGFQQWAEIMAYALAIQIILSMVLGTLIPMILNRMGLDPTVSSVPVITTFADLSAITILFMLAQFFGEVL